MNEVVSFRFRLPSATLHAGGYLEPGMSYENGSLQCCHFLIFIWNISFLSLQKILAKKRYSFSNVLYALAQTFEISSDKFLKSPFLLTNNG